MTFFKIINIFLFINCVFTQNIDKNAWVLTDVQNCFKEDLPIFGATLNMDDLASNIKDNINNIDYLLVIKDSHNGNEINNKLNWINSTGHQPNDYQIINYSDIGKNWWPTSISLEYAKIYSNYLLLNNKNPIIMWPEHCIIGTEGHKIIDKVQDSLNLWEQQKSKKIIYLEKGTNQHSETYGVLPEARLPLAFNNKNTSIIVDEIINIVTKYTNITIIGDEYSHSTLTVYKDFNEIMYNWLKIPHQYLPIIILNKNYLIDLEEKTKDTFKWIQNRIKNIINNFIEHVFQEEL